MLSASGAYRWMSCSPSARLESVLPEPKRKAGSFDHSLNGTTAHKLAEAKLKRHYGQISAAEYLKEVNEVKETPFYDEEFEKFVDDYVLYVRSQIGENDTPYFEQRVDFSDWVPEGFGTADVVIINNTTIRVIDLKFGVGNKIDAEENPQLRLYALGTWNMYKDAHPNITHIEYTISQPRLEHISTEKMELFQLLDWAEYTVRPKAKKAWAGSGDFVPGDHCTFCRAKSQCRARSDFMQAAVADDFKPPALLSEEELVTVLKRAGLIKKWISDVEEHLLKRAVDGDVPAGFTLGYTSTKRKIDDEDRVKMLLFRQGFQAEDIVEPPRLKSVAQLEKVVGKEKLIGLLGDLIVKPEGSAKLVEFTAPSDFGDFG
jgi:hypothetical protein